jgi:ParB family chromosome partitioning protein
VARLRRKGAHHMTEEKIYEIPIDKIRVSDANVRHIEPRKDIEELAASIKKHGLLQPVLLRGEHDTGPYDLIVGQRRFLAHQSLNKKTIRAVFAGDLDDIQASIRSLAENMHRSKLNHADAAKAITDLYKYFGRDEKRVKRETGMSIRRIRQYVDIEERASDEMKRRLKQGKVSPVDVQRALNAAPGDRKKADKLVQIMVRKKLTTYEKKRVVEYGAAHPKAAPDTIVAEAQRPRVEQSIMVRLKEDVRKGLEKAAVALAKDPEEVASQALAEWLSANGFISDEG